MKSFLSSSLERPVLNFQRLKAAVHFTVGKLGEQRGDELGVTFDRGVIAAVTELANERLAVVAQDLEAFSRSVVTRVVLTLILRELGGLILQWSNAFSEFGKNCRWLCLKVTTTNMHCLHANLTFKLL